MKADPFVGTWTLNPSKSDFHPNHQPRSGTVTFELDAEGHYLMSAEGTHADGERIAERPQRFILDGEGHPVEGFRGLTTYAMRPDSNTLRAEVRREDGSLAGEGTYVVSPDGQSMVATASGWDSQLRPFKQVTAWDRR